jgi:hypothetical protein
MGKRPLSQLVDIGEDRRYDFPNFQMRRFPQVQRFRGRCTLAIWSLFLSGDFFAL